MTNERKVLEARLLTEMGQAIVAYAIHFAKRNERPETVELAGPLGYIYVDFLDPDAKSEREC